MQTSKYKIKNCPAMYGCEYCIYKFGLYAGKRNCKDISDCPLKQIVEECREEIKPICQIPDGCCGMKNIYSDSKEFAEKLLSYFKIEEVDKEQESEEE